MTTYLFRQQGSHIFLCSQDPSYRYETLCGHCGYPIESDEPKCPRCRRELEDCPVCRQRTHQRAPKLLPRPDGGTVCGVCGILRYPVGHRSILETEGTFCTNLYGCPAGGMLTHSDHVVYWPDDTLRCLICREGELRPLPVSSFPLLVRRCLFCSAVFGIDEAWRIKLAEGPDRTSRLSRISAAEVPCILCGRNDDHREGTMIRSNSVGPWDRESEDHPEIPVSAYARIVELGQTLILFSEDDRLAARHLYERWFEPPQPSASRADLAKGVRIADVVQNLLEGTLNREVRRVLQRRLGRLMDQWRKLQVGLGYVIAPQDS